MKLHLKDLFFVLPRKTWKSTDYLDFPPTAYTSREEAEAVARDEEHKVISYSQMHERVRRDLVAQGDF